MNARVAACLGCLLVIAARTASAQPVPARYAEAMQQELSSLGVDAHCKREADGRHHCAWSARPGNLEVDLGLHAVYSEDSDSIYFYIERFLVLSPEGATTTATLRRLMELNWELLVGKFEWNPRSGEVRVSAVLATDSNFDRRAFRSIVRALDSIALRFYRELHT